MGKFIKRRDFRSLQGLGESLYIKINDFVINKLRIIPKVILIITQYLW